MGLGEERRKGGKGEKKKEGGKKKSGENEREISSHKA